LLQLVVASQIGNHLMSVAFKEVEFLVKNNIFSSCLLIEVVDEKDFHLLKIKGQAVDVLQYTGTRR
jgi:hypothetical protein